MFRRRRGMAGHVWPPLRPWAKSPLEAHAQQDLRRANRLMEIGDFANAAFLYEKLARALHDQGRPRQAAHLYIQAARARMLAGQVQPAEELIKQGLSIFVQAGLWEPFDRVGNRAVNELRQHNQPQAADDLARWIQDQWQNRTIPAAPVGGQEKPARKLPLKCPSCGATVRPDEVEWVDGANAMCDYCGSMLPAE